MGWFKNLFRKAPVTRRAEFFIEQEGTETPWACFEVIGFEDDGRVKVEFNWNQAFIKKIKDLGFHAETDEDCVQLFFYASQLRPTELAGGDDPVQSDEHPNLSSQQNTLVR